MGDNEIRGIGRLTDLGGHAAPSYEGGAHAREHAASRQRAGDRVDLTPPAAAALCVLRHRVLHHSRRLLQVPGTPPSLSTYDRSLSDPATFVGRVLAEQVRLATPRRGVWADAEVDSALTEAFGTGVAEALEILCERDQLDERTWRAVCAAQAAWIAKVRRANGGGLPPRG